MPFAFTERSSAAFWYKAITFVEIMRMHGTMRQQSYQW